jgi:hypothetical protein
MGKQDQIHELRSDLAAANAEAARWKKLYKEAAGVTLPVDGTVSAKTVTIHGEVEDPVGLAGLYKQAGYVDEPPAPELHYTFSPGPEHPDSMKNPYLETMLLLSGALDRVGEKLDRIADILGERLP